MTERLFAGSLHTFCNDMTQRATADVGRINRELFSDPALAGKVREIVESYTLEIARLNTDPQAITAKPMKEEHYANDYGRRHRVEVSRLQVNIPFTGDAVSLRIAPSHSTIISQPVAIDRNSLVITIADDGRADSEVKAFCAQVQGNLDTLRQEYERYKPQLEQAVSQAVERCKAQIATEKELDSRREFTVLR